MTLSLNIGSPPVALVQGNFFNNQVSGASIVLAFNQPSTAGTCLVVTLASGSGSSPTIAAFPAGWTRQIKATQGTQSTVEIWTYLSNPGGISSITFTQANPATLWYVGYEEDANVSAVSVLDASGTATSTSGTTLALTTSSNVTAAQEFAFAIWLQHLAAPAAVTFTSPVGWVRNYNDSNSGSDHIDSEFLSNPANGAPLSATMTSTGTSASSVGVIIVLKTAPPVADQSAYLVYGSLTLKLNTLDFALVDCPTVIQNMSTVTLSSPGEYPDWVGTVGQVLARDVVDVRSGHHLQVVTATNTQLPNFTGSPYDLSDNPAVNTSDSWLLENGDTWELENGSGSWLMESSVQEAGYRELSIGSQVGATSPAVTLTTIGNLVCFQPGIWCGMTFKLTSSNLANWLNAPGSLYTIASITVTYQGANPPQPVYAVQFGDIIQTLAEWTKAHAT